MSLRGLSEADSVAVDPHKWLYAPMEAGCVLMRDPEKLRDAFSYHPAYYHFGDQAVNYFDYGPQNSRGFRALKVWLALRQVGWAGYLKLIRDDMLLAGHLHHLLARHPAFEAATQSLSITTFRYVPPDLRPELGSEPVETYLNQLNQHLLTAVEERRGVSVQRAHRQHVRVEGLHRELPHISGRHRGAAPAVVAIGTGSRLRSQARGRTGISPLTS